MKKMLWLTLAVVAILAVELVLIAADARLHSAVARGAADGAKNGAATMADVLGRN